MAAVIHRRFEDFDELTAAARGWQLELSKLDRAAFVGELYQWIEDGFIVSRGRFSGHLRQVGNPPPGLRTMTVHVRRDMSQYWRGRQVTGKDLMIFPRGSEVDTVSDPRFDIFTISFDEDAFLAQADRMGCAGLAAILRNNEVLRCDQEGMDRLRRLLIGVAAGSGPAGLAADDVRWRIQAETARLLAGSAAAPDRPHRRERSLRTIRDAQDHLVKHAEEAVTVRDLSHAVGVSVRTLQHAFRRHVGVGPKAYVNALRLNAARKRLRAARPDRACVADVANQFGFWHMGQFAADYRRLFGEKPSETLARAGGRGPGTDADRGPDDLPLARGI